MFPVETRPACPRPAREMCPSGRVVTAGCGVKAQGLGSLLVRMGRSEAEARSERCFLTTSSSGSRQHVVNTAAVECGTNTVG